jgi:hypothetical protein
VALYAVCTVHMETRRAGFLVEPQHQGQRFLSGLASKPLGRFPLVWLQNWWLQVSRFGPQNQQLRFGDLGLKITTTVSWFGPQNNAGFGLSIVPRNQWREVDAGHMSKSVGLLRLEANHVRVSQSGLKAGGGTTAGGAHGTITEVVSGSS